MGYNDTEWTPDAQTKAGASTTSKVIYEYKYVHFGTTSGESAGFNTGYHEALTYDSANYAVGANNPHFGNDPDPATTFTALAATNGARSSDLIPCLWYVPDNITIDAAYSLEGADASATDTTRMHLMSYDFTSNSASILSSGTLLAHSADITNAGETKGYSATWTVDSASVAAGKVVVATFESDSVNSDYSINVTVKYHLS